MKEEFIYELKDTILTIKKCPNNVLTQRLMSDIFEKNNIEKVIIEEGIEKIDYAAFFAKRGIKTIYLPQSLQMIDESAFSRCTSLTKIIIPSNVKFIGNNIFSECSALEKINIPSSILHIPECAFYNCIKLKHVDIEEGIVSLEEGAFGNCSALKRIKLPKSLTYIGEGAFENCSNLESIEIPEGVEELCCSFPSCYKLRHVTLPKSLRVIGKHTFHKCNSLSSIKLSPNLEIIGEKAFEYSGLWRISIPSSVKRISSQAFFGCHNMFYIDFNEGLRKIGDCAFYGCTSLIHLILPNSLETIGSRAFKKCNNIISIKLSKGVKSLDDDIFPSYMKVKKIEIPEGVTSLNFSLFDQWAFLEEIHLPSSLETFYVESLKSYKRIKRMYIKCNGKEQLIDLTSKKIINSSSNKLFLYDYNSEIYSFYNNGEYIEFSREMLMKNPKSIKLINDGFIGEADFINLYYWKNKKIIPHPAIIKCMPLNDIDKFFINRNYIEWGKIVKESNVTHVDELKSLFKLCYVLGVFNESTNTRDKAINFIREKIISKMNGESIHAKFDGFSLANGFNKEYADLFIKYYNGEKFLVDEHDGDIDLTCACYNNYKQVKRIYPNKVLNTNRIADLLLPEHVMTAVSTIEYDDVDSENEEFARLVGKYGYSQEQFDTLLEWYEEAKEIRPEDMKLFVNDDIEVDGITYQLLSKSDPRSAVLGNITNCCQIIDAAGSECLEYGMTRPNSGFITFNYKDKIIAQSWVWYDEVNKVICLDNIEVPHKYIEKLNKNDDVKINFIKCILRLARNFKIEMEKHGLRVEKVTIGKGYNDIDNILKERFYEDDDPAELNDYDGYNDSESQYDIGKLKVKR